MKKTKDGLRAHQLELIQAAEKGDYLNRSLYVVEGMEGFYRRIASNSEDRAGLLTVYCGKGLIKVVPDPMIRLEMAQSGYDAFPPNVDLESEEGGDKEADDEDDQPHLPFPEDGLEEDAEDATAEA